MPTTRTSTVGLERKPSDSKSGSDKDKDSPAYLKRREQVRRAQRTHRERKENYIKALEDELLNLRARESKMTKENEALNAEVTQLREAAVWDVTPHGQDWQLQDHGAESSSIIPSSTAITDYTIPDMTVSSYDPFVFDSSNGWDFPTYDLTDRSASIASSESYLMPAASTTSSLHSLPYHLTTSSSSRQHSSSPSINSVSRTDLAIEFIMTLEKPCLNRATSAILSVGQPDTDQALSLTPTGSRDEYHSFLESSFKHDESCAPFASNGKLRMELDTQTILDKITKLAEGFCLNEELTPIQAWQVIIAHPRVGHVRLKMLRGLVEDMLEYIRCYGFGAVIPKSVFEKMCNKFFAQVF